MRLEKPKSGDRPQWTDKILSTIRGYRRAKMAVRASLEHAAGLMSCATRKPSTACLDLTLIDYAVSAPIKRLHCRRVEHLVTRARSLLSDAAQNEVNTNTRMVDYMRAKNIISSDPVIHAFNAIDRAYFLKGGEGANTYLNIPIRDGILHLSAPGIYGLAIEALNFSAGLSFLNVGSGTGYVSAIAAQLLGSQSIHFGVELQPKLVRRPNDASASLPLSQLDFQRAPLRFGSHRFRSPDTRAASRAGRLRSR